jgi:ubiquinone/menaquinone biosynthesis C-methylase UbiE
MANPRKNLDVDTVNSFGDEWSRFDQSALSEDEAHKIFDEYFAIFPWDSLPENATGFDMGCGSGRWARLMVPRVGHLHCIDPSSALEVAKTALSSATNVSFYQASVDDSPLPPNSQDFGYALVLLCYKNSRRQHGQRGRERTRWVAICRRTEAMD